MANIPPNMAVLANELGHTNEELAILIKEIEDLKKWRNSCTLWAARWAGVCGAVMALAGLIQAYWTHIKAYMANTQ